EDRDERDVVRVGIVDGNDPLLRGQGRCGGAGHAERKQADDGADDLHVTLLLNGPLTRPARGEPTPGSASRATVPTIRIQFTRRFARPAAAASPSLRPRPRSRAPCRTSADGGS